MTVSRRLRYEILRRDGFTCRYCGGSAPDATLTIDHVVPVALGGEDDPSNLVAACRECNAGKTSTSPNETTVEEVDATAMLFSAAMKKATEIHRSELLVIETGLEEFEKEWSQYLQRSTGLPFTRSPHWRSTLSNYLKAGLTQEDLVVLVRVAIESKADSRWNYFCGCCKRRIQERTDLALRLIEDGQI